jgi:hypothetical protein
MLLYGKRSLAQFLQYVEGHQYGNVPLILLVWRLRYCLFVIASVPHQGVFAQEE